MGISNLSLESAKNVKVLSLNSLGALPRQNPDLSLPSGRNRETRPAEIDDPLPLLRSVLLRGLPSFLWHPVGEPVLLLLLRCWRPLPAVR